ncbi:MAG: AI-2E family transporter [Gemmatimonadota bacterium]|nr:AI-2E family transporter [Gemmatimonadota bacterium]
MAFLDTRRQRAGFVILLLGIGIFVAMSPYATGLLGAAVLYALFAPLNAWFRRYLSPAVASAVVTGAAALLILLPGASVATLLVTQAQNIASGIVQSPLLTRVKDVEVAGYAVGPSVADAGQQLVRWLGASAFGFIGTATRAVLNVTIALFGVYFLLLRPDDSWETFRPYVPFSAENTELLRQRFRDVTNSTILGVVVIALVQGVLLGTAFWVLGLDDALFWGTITGILSVLPVVGSGLIWAPASVVLALDGRWGAAVGLLAWGLVIVSSADNFIRPVIYRRWARIHPVVTLVGALAGIRYFGVLGILVGPLALSYFFELIRMYREEYVEPAERFRQMTGEMPAFPTGTMPTVGNPPAESR